MTSPWLAVTATRTISDWPLRLVAGCWPPPLVWPEGAGVGDGWAVGAAAGGSRVPTTRASWTTSLTDPCCPPTGTTWPVFTWPGICLLYTSDAADDLLCVD